MTWECDHQDMPTWRAWTRRSSSTAAQSSPLSGFLVSTWGPLPTCNGNNHGGCALAEGTSTQTESCGDDYICAFNDATCVFPCSAIQSQSNKKALASFSLSSDFRLNRRHVRCSHDLAVTIFLITPFSFFSFFWSLPHFVPTILSSPNNKKNVNHVWILWWRHRINK